MTLTLDSQRTESRRRGEVIRRHPLLSFFVLANLLSWLAWTPYVLSQNGLGLWDYRYPAVLGSSQILGVLPGAYLGPVFSAFLVTLVADGRDGLRRWVRRLWHWRVRWHWYAVALLGVPAVLLLTGLVFSGGQIQAPSVLVLAVYVPALLFQMVTTGLAEEPGWRDFALPRLQDRFGPLRASLVLGPLWAVWHLPLFLSDWGGWPHVSVWAPIEFVAACIPLSLVMTWVFNRTGQSLPIVMFLHAGVNSTYSSVWSEIFPTLDVMRDPLHVQLIATTVVALVLIIATRGRLGLSVPPR